MCSLILCFQLIDKISIGLTVKDQTLQVELYDQLRVYLQSDIPFIQNGLREGCFKHV